MSNRHTDPHYSECNSTPLLLLQYVVMILVLSTIVILMSSRHSHCRGSIADHSAGGTYPLIKPLDLGYRV